MRTKGIITILFVVLFVFLVVGCRNNQSTEAQFDFAGNELPPRSDEADKSSNTPEHEETNDEIDTIEDKCIIKSVSMTISAIKSITAEYKGEQYDIWDNDMLEGMAWDDLSVSGTINGISDNLDQPGQLEDDGKSFLTYKVTKDGTKYEMKLGVGSEFYVVFNGGKLQIKFDTSYFFVAEDIVDDETAGEKESQVSGSIIGTWEKTSDHESGADEMIFTADGQFIFGEDTYGLFEIVDGDESSGTILCDLSGSGLILIEYSFIVEDDLLTFGFPDAADKRVYIRMG